MKKKLLWFSVLLVIANFAFAQRYGVPNFKIVSDFTNENVFTSGIEGPAVDKKGYLYVVNFKQEGTIGVVDYFGNASLFVELPAGSVGNSIVIDTLTNQMYVADYTKHNILKIDMATKQVSVFAHDDQFNQPNDICRKSNGDFYASDPNWKDGQGNIWFISANGYPKLLESNLGCTNGIALSRDEKYLYVSEQINNSISGQYVNIWKYLINPNGTLGEKELLIKFPDFGVDGMKIDTYGNLFITRYGKGTVAIVSPEGQMIREISLTGKKPTNIVFGGADYKTCYVTMQDRGCIETFRMPKYLAPINK